jgi:hypothetical protein
MNEKLVLLLIVSMVSSFILVAGCTTQEPRTNKTITPMVTTANSGHWIKISPVGDKIMGDQFEITGFTTQKENSEIFVFIVSNMSQKGGTLSGMSGVTRVKKGKNNINNWSFQIDTRGLKVTGLYDINVYALDPALGPYIQNKNLTEDLLNIGTLPPTVQQKYLLKDINAIGTFLLKP